MSTSTNMNMPIPDTGVTPGPTYADNINSSLNIIDQHDHSSGSGVQITPSGLNINAQLTLNNNILSNIQALTLYAQLTPPADLSVYASSTDLYFVDGNGNNVRITQSGSVAGSAGTITGLPSGTASASFAASTFTFQSATNTAANVDGRNFILRNSTASSFGLTLTPPTAMGANFSLVLPSLPLTTQAVNLDSSGNMGTITYDAIGQAMTATGANAIANTRTRSTGTSVAVGGVAISTGSSSYTMNSSTPADVTNLTVTITTSGRPVYITFISDAVGTGASYIGASQGSGSTAMAPTLYYFRDSSEIARDSIALIATATASGVSIFQLAPNSFGFIDAVAAGTYTYKIQTSNGGGSVVLSRFQNVRLVAYEL